MTEFEVISGDLKNEISSYKFQKINNLVKTCPVYTPEEGDILHGISISDQFILVVDNLFDRGFDIVINADTSFLYYIDNEFIQVFLDHEKTEELKRILAEE